MNARATFTLIITAAAIAVPQAPALAKAPDAKAWSGSWRMDTAKSKFSSAEYTPKSDTRSYSVKGNRITLSSTMVTAQGKTMKWSYSANTDGKWYPVSGNTGMDRVSLTLAGARELRSEGQLKGKAASKATLTVSDDGKQLTVHRSLVTPKGPTDDTVVYERIK